MIFSFGFLSVPLVAHVEYSTQLDDSLARLVLVDRAPRCDGSQIVTALDVVVITTGLSHRRKESVHWSDFHSRENAVDFTI